MKNVIDLENVLYKYLTPYDILKALGRYHLSIGVLDWDPDTNPHPLHFTTLLENMVGNQKDVKLKDADLNAFAYNAMGKLAIYPAIYYDDNKIYNGLEEVRFRLNRYVLSGLTSNIKYNFETVFKFDDYLLIDLVATDALYKASNSQTHNLINDITKYSIDLAKRIRNFYNNPSTIPNGNEIISRIDKECEERNQLVSGVIQEFRINLENENYSKEEIDKIVNKVQTVLMEGKEKPHHNMEFSETFINSFMTDDLSYKDERELLEEACDFGDDLNLSAERSCYSSYQGGVELKHNFKVIVNLDAFLQTFIKNIDKKLTNLNSIKIKVGINYESEIKFHNAKIKFLKEVKDKATELSNQTIDNLIRNTDYHILELLYEVAKNSKVKGTIEEFINIIDKLKEERRLKIEAEKKQVLVNDFEGLISSLDKEELNDLYNALNNGDNIYEKLTRKKVRASE